MQWKTPDDEKRNCPKRVEFYSKNKLQKSVQLVGFIIRIYHDARSSERQFITMHGQLNVKINLAVAEYSYLQAMFCVA